MDLVTPLIPIARDGLDLGDAALAVDPNGSRTLALIEGGATELDPALAAGMAEVIVGLGTQTVLLLRRADGRPEQVDRDAWALLTAQVPPDLLADGLVVGDHRAWSLRTDSLVPEPLRTSA